MNKNKPAINPIEILRELSEIPVQCSERNQALTRITQLCQQAMRSRACELALVHVNTGELRRVAFASDDPHTFDGYEEQSLLSASIKRLGVIEAYDLGRQESELIDARLAHRFNVGSLLSHPIRVENRTVGRLTHFSCGIRPFNVNEKRLLEIFARNAMVTMEKFDYQALSERSVRIFNNLMQNLLSLSSADFLQTVAEETKGLLSVPVCIVWKLNEQEGTLSIAAATDSVDAEYRKIILRLSETGFEKSGSSTEIVYIPDISKDKQYLYAPEAKERGWVSMLSASMRVNGRLIGMLDVYTKELHYFRKWERDFFGAFAHHAALSLDKAELLRKTEETDNNQKRLMKLTDIMLQMTAASKVEELLKQLLHAGLELVNADRGWISLLDDKSGELNIVTPEENIPGKRRLRLGKGLTGKALLEERPIRTGNVAECQGSYEKFWDDTQSEMAIPMLIGRAPVRIGREVKLATKPIGVLNIESTLPNVFSKMDEDCLLSLAYQAAIIIDNLDNERKRIQLQNIERKIAGDRDYEQTIQTLLRGITSTLGFEYIIISLINSEQNYIRAEYVKGLASKHEIDKLKEMAVYPLTGNSIHAHVANQGEIFVPDSGDERFHSTIYKKFGLDRMLTVFVPMTSSTDNRPIGIVEAGHQKMSGQYIYERDVQILQNFVDYVVQAFEQKRSGMLDKVSHEFRAPLAGIRNNTSFLQRRINELPEELINTKFEDILTDCEILLHQVGELEHLLGRPSPVSKVEKTLVYRDVIIKTINQLKPIIRERGFDHSHVYYNPADSSRIRMYVDKIKLNQVVFNLLTNSIKYAENNPDEFRINLEIEETRESFTIKFQDWGIGINSGLEEKIFEEGFRTPEAHRMNVNGSGLGLTIARNLIKTIGGNLKLTSNSKPTEFQLVLPKKLSEAPT